MSNKKRTGAVPETAASVVGLVPDPPPVPTAKATMRKPTPQAPAGAGFCVYIGPSIPGVIQSGHIYSGSRADVLKTLTHIVEKRPLVASLIVDGTTHVTDRIKVKTPGNLLYVNYKKLVSGENE